MDRNPVKSVSFYGGIGAKVTIEFSPRMFSFTAKEAQALSYKIQLLMEQELPKMAPDAFPDRVAELRAAINGGAA